MGKVETEIKLIVYYKYAMCQEGELQDIWEYVTGWHIYYYITSSPNI